MEIIKMSNIEGFRTKTGVLAKQLIKHKDTTVMNINLEVGQSIPEHSVPVNVFFYVVVGKGTLSVGGEEQVVEATDIVLCPPDTQMSLRADQGDRFVVLNVKTPSI